MSAVLLAVFDNYEAADHVRVDLIRDGFPTDRVELTCSRELGRASLEPAVSPRGKFAQFFGTLFCREDERPEVERIADSIEQGAAAITVLPRGLIETARATQIIQNAGPREVVNHDLTSQTMEYAAARNSRPWVSSFWIESDNHADCIYCRLFERSFD